MKEEEKRKFYYYKPIKVLITILDLQKSFKPVYIYGLTKKFDISYSYAIKTLSMFKKHKLITLKKKGRNKYIDLTVKGYTLANCFKKIDNFL